MLGYLQHGLVFRRLRSLRRLKWVRLEWALLVQRRPKGVLLALVRRSGDLETLLSVSRTTRLARGVVRFSDYSSRQGSRTSPHKSRQGSDSPPRKRRSGDSPQHFSDYSSRQGTLLRVSRTTRLARGLSSEFLGLTRPARGLSSEFLGLLVSPGESYPTPEE